MLQIIRNPFKFKLYLIKYLPAAYFSGLKVEDVTEKDCTVSIPYKYFTKNPFRSTYFACLSMAAEMSTGILAMLNIYNRKQKVSMLVVALEANFYKKATGKTRFVCAEGDEIKSAIETAIKKNEPQTIKVKSIGFDESNELIAEFRITWSFKVRNNI